MTTQNTPTPAEILEAFLMLLDGTVDPEDIVATTGISLEQATHILDVRNRVVHARQTFNDNHP